MSLGWRASGVAAGLLAAIAVGCTSGADSRDLFAAADAGATEAADPDSIEPASRETPPRVESLEPPFPTDNPPSAAKTALGRLLFWDPVLSGERDVACASCHSPDLGYADGEAFSRGTGGATTARSAMPILDSAWNGRTVDTPRPDARNAPMFWDNRTRSLEAQAGGPITNAGEMRGTAIAETDIFPTIVARLEAIPAYADAFAQAFGSPAIDETAIVRAIAAFERTLVTTSSYDRFLGGDDRALGARARRGLAIFRSSGCERCHSGPMLSDYRLHRFARNGEALRTPTLRNLLRTAPYMHDGRAPTLDAVLDVYRRVDRAADPAFRGLAVPPPSALDDLRAFFAAVSDGDFDRAIPTSVPSGLPPGGRRSATIATR